MSYADSLNAVTDKLRQFGELDRVESARADKNSTLSFLAVRVPYIRASVRCGFTFYDLDSNLLLHTWDYIWKKAEYYEVMLAALIYYQDVERARASEIFPTALGWMLRVDNWGHCDSLAALYAEACVQDHDRVFPSILTLSESPRLWDRRAAIVSLVRGMRRGALSVPFADVPLILDRVVSEEEPYIAKAVAWVLREAMRANPSETMAYLASRRPRFGQATLFRTKAEFRRSDKTAFAILQEDHI